MIVGIGIDLVHIPRIERMIARYGQRFLNRVYTRQEAEICQKRNRPHEAYAIRFAAKEACSKALGTGMRQGIAWRQMEVLQESSGRPFLVLSGNAERAARQLGAKGWMVSLSHEGEYAIAVVMLQTDS